MQAPDNGALLDLQCLRVGWVNPDSSRYGKLPNVDGQKCCFVFVLTCCIFF